MYLEINNQAMYAEGSSDTPPTINEIESEISKQGYIASKIDIVFDDFQDFWRFTADIKRANNAYTRPFGG